MSAALGATANGTAAAGTPQFSQLQVTSKTIFIYILKHPQSDVSLFIFVPSRWCKA